jgi:MFS superfamily sulfate permease-like transporter
MAVACLAVAAGEGGPTAGIGPTFTADLIAGVTVGLVALPLAMAFAISSGMPPQAGIYTAVATGFVVSALGGSMVQIGGPTGAFVVVVHDEPDEPCP